MKFLENKIPPPLVALLTAAGMWWLSTLTPLITLTSTIKMALVAVFTLSGAFFALAGAVSFRLAKTTVNPLKPDTASSLVTSGIYQFSRNPMYVGFVAFLFAWTSYLESAWGVALIAVYVAYIQRFQIMPEERALIKIFKDEFINYKKQVRPWL
ncbi:methyltransferase family protein [Colwellia psychrerythraea]|uniref:Phospholipid methyltransferase n=1 Tax=Colwellia psychrerythraea TaxID=28229 RepID=A0A099L6B0_COLPS|nr:isoprenylcysteine carboxylmethyltransferase family protein [Colwellia psychrerythraea]KGJ97428.1 phospholipid methyltransferase [Colwellia psychrerythraea]